MALKFEKRKKYRGHYREFKKTAVCKHIKNIEAIMGEDMSRILRCQFKTWLDEFIYANEYISKHIMGAY